MSGDAKPVAPVLRVARPSNDLDALRRFYIDGLGLFVLGEFTAHQGFDGLILGGRGAPYHLEFTREHGVVAPRAPSKEMLLVFYLPDQHEFELAIERMRLAGASQVEPVNPYWKVHGVTFEDPDGYRVVLQHAAWNI
jgi:catechol 2,3-dioxygenase-like lactoylglutathione lyase family enzyme